MGKTKLSIIIPAYNAEPYLCQLVACLQKQVPLDKSVEVLLIDDGSSEPVQYTASWLKIYRQPNQGVSVARNAGIDKAKGDYISFIDADDLVSDNFISTILEKTKDEPDVIELSSVVTCNSKILLLCFYIIYIFNLTKNVMPD